MPVVPQKYGTEWAVAGVVGLVEKGGIEVAEVRQRRVVERPQQALGRSTCSE